MMMMMMTGIHMLSYDHMCIYIYIYICTYIDNHDNNIDMRASHAEQKGEPVSEEQMSKSAKQA